MKMARYLVVLLLALIGCTSDAPEMETARARLSVYVVNYPLQYFAERIGGDLVEVHFPAPADEDPAFWEPDAATVQAYQSADLILLNGATYAKWAELASLPPSKLVNTSAGFGDRYIVMEGVITHTHGPEGPHEHGGTAFTTWLDPTLAEMQARAIADALRPRLPQHTVILEQNLEALTAELRELDQAFERALAPVRDQPLIASHPVYQYFARRYGLDLHAVHWEPDEMPSEEEWSHLPSGKWMLWEAPPIEEVTARLRERRITPIVVFPQGNAPADGDYLDVMRQNVERLETALSVATRP